MPTTTPQPPLLLTSSPLGPLWLEQSADGAAVVALHWGHPPAHLGQPVTHHPFVQQLADYFAGKQTSFTIPVQPAGTAFQQRVWQGLQSIPWGHTRSYGQLAAQVGTHARPLGSANGKNPLPIIIPCHRVLGSSDLGGYSAPGGLTTKRWLLAHEGVVV
jgi:methylated-DNA-[protein]-cysteine S-methyltransferase